MCSVIDEDWCPFKIHDRTRLQRQWPERLPKCRVGNRWIAVICEPDCWCVSVLGLSGWKLVRWRYNWWMNVLITGYRGHFYCWILVKDVMLAESCRDSWSVTKHFYDQNLMAHQNPDLGLSLIVNQRYVTHWGLSTLFLIFLPFSSSPTLLAPGNPQCSFIKSAAWKSATSLLCKMLQSYHE